MRGRYSSVTTSLVAFGLASAALAPAAMANTYSPAPSLAATQDPTPDAVASQVDQPEDEDAQALEPIGARLGSFIFYPKLEAALTYDDNIYALKSKTDDVVARVSPSFSLDGDFGSTTATFAGSLDRFQYFDKTTENRTDWNLGANVQTEVRRDVFAYFAAGHSQLHEDRGDPNSTATAAEPNSFHLTEAGLGLSANPARVLYGVDFSYRHTDYQDNRQVGGALLENDTRDRDTFLASGRLGYEFSPGYSILFRGAYEKRDYVKAVNVGGYNRDSEGVRATVGVNFELSRLLTGEVYVGYLNRSYTDARINNINDITFGSTLAWTPTELTTVRLNADRTAEETIASGFGSYLNTSFSLGVEHELLRTLKLTAGVNYANSDYQRARNFTGTQRSDDSYGLNVGAKYQFNRNMYAGVRYDWSKRDSNVTQAGTQFNRNRISATFGLQF